MGEGLADVGRCGIHVAQRGRKHGEGGDVSL